MLFFEIIGWLTWALLALVVVAVVLCGLVLVVAGIGYCIVMLVVFIRHGKRGVKELMEERRK